MKIWIRINKIFVTFFGCGLSPVAPGTVGSAGGLLIGYWIVSYLPFSQFLLLGLIVLFTIFGAYSARLLEKEWGEDPSRIVLDEAVGMWISMLFLPCKWEVYLAAFILFRLFDIYKPFYIRRMENIRNGWGVMLDDVVAGIYSNIIIQIALVIFKAYIIY